MPSPPDFQAFAHFTLISEFRCAGGCRHERCAATQMRCLPSGLPGCKRAGTPDAAAAFFLRRLMFSAPPPRQFR